MRCRSACLLVVVHDAEMRSTIAALLRARGYRVTLAACDEDALGLLAQHPFDLLLLDPKLLQGSSGDFAKCVHRLQPDLGVIMCGGVMPFDRLSSDELAAIYAYVPVTAGPQAVLNAVAAILASRQESIYHLVIWRRDHHVPQDTMPQASQMVSHMR